MNNVRQGQVYWLDIGPSSGSAPADRHACKVVQDDIFNQSAIGTTVVCLITSNLARAKAPGKVLPKKGGANLPKVSIVNVAQVLTVDNSDLVDCCGKHPRSAMACTSSSTVYNPRRACPFRRGSTRI